MRKRSTVFLRVKILSTMHAKAELQSTNLVLWALDRFCWLLDLLRVFK